jgi:hypothetical protein
MISKINLETEEFNRLALALERDLKGCPEEAKQWEYILVKRLRIYGSQTDKHICDFCDGEFADGYLSNAITSCRKCSDIMEKEEEK